MLDSFLKDLLFFRPEIVLSLSSICFLLLGSYSKIIRRFIPLCMMIFAIISCFITYNLLGNERTLFSNAIVCNSYVLFVKIFLLLAFAFALIALHTLSSDNTIQFEISVLLSLSVVGMMVMVSANDLLVIYLGLELMSLPLYILVANGHKANQSNEAGIKFFMLGALSSCLYLFGSSIMYGFVGSTCFDSIGKYYISVMNGNDIEISVPIIFLVSVIFIISAFFFKVSAAPFHMWTPDVYQGSSAFINMFLATAPKIASISVLVSILYIPFVDLIDQWQQVTVFCSILSMVIGSLGGIVQKSFRRMLGYSTVGHVGFILMSISVGELYGISGAFLYTIIYVMMTFFVFIVLLFLEQTNDYDDNIKHLGGLSKSHPFLALSIMFAMLSMAGIPPLAGFFAKFHVLISVIGQELYALAIVGVIATVISCYYYLRIIKIMYFDHSHIKSSINIPFVAKILIFLLAIFNLGYVIMPSTLLKAARLASEALISV